MPPFRGLSQLQHNQSQMPELFLQKLVKSCPPKSYLSIRQLLLMLPSMYHFLLQIDQISINAHYHWVHSLAKHHLLDSIHYVAQKCDLKLSCALVLAICSVCVDVFEPHSAMSEELFNLIWCSIWVGEDVRVVGRTDILILDLIVVAVGLILLSKLFYDWHIFLHQLHNMIRGKRQFRPDQNKPRADVVKFFTFHIHGIPGLIRLQIITHHKTAQ